VVSNKFATALTIADAIRSQRDAAPQRESMAIPALDGRSEENQSQRPYPSMT
jgi:hypothetical protein